MNQQLTLKKCTKLRLRKILWFPFFGIAPLWATVNEPLRLDWATGYRNDHFHWHLQQPGESGSLYTERAKAIQFWQNDLQLSVVHRDLSFLVQGGVGVFGRSSLQQTWNRMSFATDSPQFEFSTSGWAAHGLGWFGYAVNLTADRLYKVILTPLVGYEGFVLHFHRKGVSPDPFASDHAVGGGSYTAASMSSYNEHTSWNGWFLGGNLSFQPVGRLRYGAGYAYHLLHARLSAQASLNASLQDNAFSIHFSEGGNFGHSGWIRGEYEVARRWRIGLAAAIRYFFSTVQDVTAKQTEPVVSNIARKIKIRWTAVTGLATISREF